MERLTKRYELGAYKISSTITDSDIYEKLADYEDAEEQGLLEIFICNTGDIVYYVRSTFEKPMEFMIERIEVYEDEIIYVDADNNEWFKDDFGKLVFLTKEEAEKKLAEMGGEV